MLPISSSFQFTIEFQINNISVGKYVGVASNGKMMTMYHHTAGSYAINIFLSAGAISNLNMTLYGPFTSLSYTGGSSQAINTVSSSQAALTYSSKSGSYYYLVVSVSNNVIYTESPFVRILYETDEYQCPYGTDAADYNGVFRGCSTALPTRVYPCINFDNTLNKCLSCQAPWVATDKGVCIVDTQCPVTQYYRFGQCLDPIKNCATFESIGGLCLTCANNYNLTVLSTGVQECIFILPICVSGYYLLGTSCKKYVENCVNFLTQTATC